MMKLIRELRRREVFRTAGLYVGVAWIVIEASSLTLDAFDAPEWVLRALIIAAIVGLPITIILAWIYDVTDKGIVVQGEATDTVVIPFGGRKTDFAVIGVLLIALSFSIYLNVTGTRTEEDGTIDPVSVLIADFVNHTGDELFNGTLEQALQIGIESAPFIAGYRRESAKKLAVAMEGGNDTLDENKARLIAVREGVKLVMAGSIEENKGRYRLYVRAIDPKGGETLTEAEVDAKDKLDVLAAVGTLSGDLREELGDDLDRERLVTSETFTAKNLEAAQAYSRAQSLQYNGKYDEAMVFYEQALQFDPGFGRAYSGLALSAYALGKTEQATELWEKALATLDTMTEREKLRTLGLYFSIVTQNYDKAIETYQTLVEKYPADDAAHNGLAVQYFYTLQFAEALKEGAILLDIYPNSIMGRSNYALYAMYAGDFHKAMAEAEKVREKEPGYFKAWLPEAMHALAEGDIGMANEAYAQMMPGGVRGEMTAALGQADAALFVGNAAAARELLNKGIETARSVGSQYFLATMQMALAEAYLLDNDMPSALAAANEGLALSGGLPRQVPAALVRIAAGDVDGALAIGDELGKSLQAQNHAYAALIGGLVARARGDTVAAVQQIRAGIEMADLWLLRFHLGIAYLEAGYFAEALDEFTACMDRQGEATAVFLDDLPTWRYMATLPYWQGRAQQELGMLHAAKQNLMTFAARRPEGDPLADDARQRMR